MQQSPFSPPHLPSNKDRCFFDVALFQHVCVNKTGMLNIVVGKEGTKHSAEAQALRCVPLP